MTTTYTKKFKEFIEEHNPADNDYLVGYRKMDDTEIRIPLIAIDNSITADKYIRKDINDYANGIIKFNSGLVTGDSVMSTIYLLGLTGWYGDASGNFEMNSLTIREFLEVPELRKNKITVMGNQFWFTDSALVKEIASIGNSRYNIIFKLEDKEYSSFELNDILKGIYHYGNGFYTTYLLVYELILDGFTGGEIGVRVQALNSREPRASMLLVRINNTSDKDRQGSVFVDGIRKYIRVIDGYDPLNPTSEGSLDTLRVQMGDLSSIVDHPAFGTLEGYGLYADNVYLTGKLVVKNNPNLPGQELGVYRGVWNATADYYKYDQVTYNGSLYTSKLVKNIGHIPTGKVDDLWWELTVSKGNDGTSADSAIIMELTNDNHNMPTNADGSNPSYGGAYCSAVMFSGTTDITDAYTIEASLEGPTTSAQLQFVLQDNTVTITFISNDIDNATIKFLAHATGYPTISKLWSITKVKSGISGLDATSYWLVTDSPVIKRLKSGIYQPSPFVVRALHQVGQGAIQPYDGFIKLIYGTETLIISGSICQFVPSADVSKYNIELYKDSALTMLLDKEIVSVVEDGSDGSDGAVADWHTYIFKLSISKPTTPTFNRPPTTYPVDGWYDIPSDTGVWWMSTAVVTGNTNLIKEWSIPNKVTGEDGQPGEPGQPGESAYSLYFLGVSSVEFFREGEQFSFTATAALLEGTKNITDTIHQSGWVWQRYSPDSLADEIWNTLHLNIGNTITITQKDVFDDTRFVLDVYANNGLRLTRKFL